MNKTKASEIYARCNHRKEASFLTDGELYHYKGTVRIKCQDFDSVKNINIAEVKDQSSAGIKDLTTDVGCVKLRHRTGVELAYITLCSFANGTCHCKNSDLGEFCVSVKAVHEKIVELTVRD